MTTVRKSALVPYSAHEMYELVADIERYGEFLPWCGGARILARDGDTVTAAILIAYRGVNKSFTTRNSVVPDRSMEMRLVEGPFRHLLGNWRFEPLEEHASKVSLDLEFEFANPLLAIAVGPVFNHIANGLVDSFRKRAAQMHGAR
ncbi:MAG TPA: type II toxin-antitoxin system RatA family toxin [Acidiferrobacterales bacterium]